MMDVLTKEFAIAFPGSDLTAPLEPEYYDDEDEKESIIDTTASVRDGLTESHRQLLLRLEPLRRVQRNLEKTLGAASTEEVHSGTGSVAPWATPKFRSREFAVTSRSGWKSALNRVRGIKSDGSSAYNEKVAMGQVRSRSSLSCAIRRTQHVHQPPRRSSVSRMSEAKSDMFEVEPDVEHASEVIAACADDMYALWMDPVVRAVLDRRGMRPEEGPGL